MPHWSDQHRVPATQYQWYPLFLKVVFLRKFAPIFVQCQTLIDEVSASHSTDLQQRAYEFQALLGLSPQAIENVMPPDASCEDVEVLFFDRF